MPRERPDLAPIAAILNELKALAPASDPVVLADLETTLLSALRFDRQIPKVDHLTLVRRAVRECLAATTNITSQLIESYAAQASQVYLAQPLADFFLATNVRIQQRRRILTRHQGNIVLKIGRSFPAAIQESRASLSRLERELGSVNAAYSALTCEVKARTPEAAADAARSAVDLQRGVWNFSINRRVAWRVMADPEQPMNQVRCGRTQTLHKQDGSLALEGYWTIAGRLEQRSYNMTSEQWRVLLRDERMTARQMRRCRYREDMENAFIRYARALDTADWETVFLKLWSLLELLTATERERNDDTIRRCAFLYSDRDAVKLTLQHLREQRNSAVHHDDVSSETQLLAMQVSKFVEQLLHFHLSYGDRLASLEEAGQFLSLSVEQSVLERQMALRGLALAFLGSDDPSAGAT